MTHEEFLMDTLLKDVSSRGMELRFSILPDGGFIYSAGKRWRGIKLDVPVTTRALLGAAQVVFDSIEKTIKVSA